MCHSFEYKSDLSEVLSMLMVLVISDGCSVLKSEFGYGWDGIHVLWYNILFLFSECQSKLLTRQIQLQIPTSLSIAQKLQHAYKNSSIKQHCAVPYSNETIDLNLFFSPEALYLFLQSVSTFILPYTLKAMVRVDTSVDQGKSLRYH